MNAHIQALVVQTPYVSTHLETTLAFVRKAFTEIPTMAYDHKLPVFINCD